MDNKKKSVFFLVLSFFLLIACLEGLARMYQYFKHDAGMQVLFSEDETGRLYRLHNHEYSKIKHDFHPYLLYRIRPSQNFATCSINSSGYRGKEFSRDKGKDIYRIAVLGGSVVFGSGAVSNDYTISALLEGVLNSHSTGKKFEVINAGMNGYIISQERILLEEELLGLDLDMIIVFDGFNDACSPMQGGRDGLPPAFSQVFSPGLIILLRTI